jgi:predicted Zn-dependent protease
VIGDAELEALAAGVLAAGAKVVPGAEVSAFARASRDANTRFAVNGIVSSGDVEEIAVTVRVAIGKRAAATTTNQTDPAALRGTVERAAAMARLAPEDPEAMPLLPPQTYAAAPSAFDAPTAELSAEARAKAAAAAIAVAKRADLRIAGFLSHGASAWLLATSTGLRARHRESQVSLSATARTADASGSGWAGRISNRVADLDPAELARIASEKAVASARPRRLDPGRYTVVLEPAAVADLLSFLPLDARAVDEGRSVFTRPGGGSRVGEAIASELITIRSDPFDPAAPTAPFDEEGLPLAPTTWIDRGTLRALAYSRYWAAKQQKAPTGYPRALSLAGGSADGIADLMSGVERGLLVTRFWYTRMLDPQQVLVTGLTRDGVFLIEKGKITAPVQNFRFNESPIAMLKGCDALTRQVVRSPTNEAWRVPAIRARDFTMASVSEAV